MSKTQRDKLAYYLKKIEAEIKGQEFEDFCEEFQFDKVGDKEDFNLRFNDPYLKKLLEYDRTGDFFRDTDRQIILISNLVLFIFGPRGEGKSEILQKLMKYWQRRFKDLKKKQVNKHRLINYIGFSDAQMLSIIRLMGEGDIAGRDESPLTSGEETATVKKNIQNIINQTRGLQTSLILINPDPLEVSGVDYYLEVVGKDRATETTRCIWYDRRMREMGIIYLTLHNDTEFREQYGKKKYLNMITLLYRGGGSWGAYDKEQFTRDLINLYEFCIECNASSLADVKTMLTNYNLQFDPENKEDAKKVIGGTNNYINNVVKNVFWGIRGNLKPVFKGFREYLEQIEQPDVNEGLNKEEREKILSQIQIEVQDEAKEDEFSLFLTQYYYKILPTMVKINQKNSVKKETILEILESWGNGIGIRNISFDVNVHQGIVNDILKLFKDGKRGKNTILDAWRLYKMYEFWSGYKYNLKIISGHNKPDWIFKIDLKKIPGECKLFDDIKNSIRIHKEQKLHSYKQFKDDLHYIPVLVRNVKWGNFDFLFKVTVNDDPYFTFVNDPDYIIETMESEQFEDIYKKKEFSYEEV